MQTRGDPEAEVLLAVLPTPAAAAEAKRALEAAGIPTSESPISPGPRQMPDASLADENRASIRAPIAGAIVGGLVGAGLAVWFAGGVVAVVAALAAGAFVGSRIALLIPLAAASRHHTDAVPGTPRPNPSATPIVIRAEAPVGRGAHARDILVNAGAVALLDLPAYEARVSGSAKSPSPQVRRPAA